MVQFDEEKPNLRLEELHKKEEEDLAKTLSEKYGLPYADLLLTPINIDALRVIEEDEAREAKIAPFNIVNKKLSVAVKSPNDTLTQTAINNLEKKGYQVDVYMASMSSLNKVWSRYDDLSYSLETKGGLLDISSEQITNFLSKVHQLKDIKTLIQEIIGMKKTFRISRIVEIILAGALATRASDVHIEPEEDYVRLRYRLDGVLVDILTFDHETYNLMLSRIKLIAGLKLNVKKTSQDGRFSIVIGESDIEIRASVLPGAYDESLVLRILNPKTISVPMEELGIHPRLLEKINPEIGKPNGMILTTGPTGSGKTTTLYAFLRKIHRPEIKIITIENPIEYHLPGIVQTQTDDEKGYTFSLGLRSSLRQDPDVIMVGEIRDSETAGIAVNAALTGHLVFSTLHTNDAAGSFPRLIDLGVNSKIISSALNIALAQRLVRRLCPDCKKKVTPSAEDKAHIEKILGAISDKNYTANLTGDYLWQATGCEKCNQTGYRGRIGLFEAILMDEKIENIISLNPSTREIRKEAAGQNLLTIAQDGIIKVLEGITSLEELKRVVDIENAEPHEENKGQETSETIK